MDSQGICGPSLPAQKLTQLYHQLYHIHSGWERTLKLARRGD